MVKVSNYEVSLKRVAEWYQNYIGPCEKKIIFWRRRFFEAYSEFNIGNILDSSELI